MKEYLSKTIYKLFIVILFFASCTKEDAAKIPTPISITTSEISSIRYGSATGGGNIDGDASAIIQRGVVWDTVETPTEQLTTKTLDGIDSGNYVSTLTNLIPQTTYFVRAYVTTDSTTLYGDQVSFTTTQLKDVEDNVYAIVILGSQVWMTENLKTTKYPDGINIPAGMYNLSYKDTYGVYYRWEVAIKVTAGSLPEQGVCPNGWHVPSFTELSKLYSYLIESGFNYDDTFTGNKIAKSLASTTGWSPSNVTGAIGNTDYPDKRNSSGMNVLPAGYGDFGSISWIGSFGTFWTSTSVKASIGDDFSHALVVLLRSPLASTFTTDISKGYYAPCRCLKN